MALSDRQLYALEAMGIPVWLCRHGTSPDVSAPELPRHVAQDPDASHQADRPPVVATADGDTAQQWQRLEQAVRACTKCELHRSRTQVVFGVGNRQARWLVIGEAPGAEEDRQGEPFVGRAGQLLNEMLRAAGLRREQVYIANILKCRPPENRDPKPEEAAMCEQYLQAQIALVRPALILAVGRIAAQNLLHDETPVGKLRGRVHRYGPDGIPVVVTYHPAYLLRSPGQKRRAWEDLCLAMATVPPLPAADIATNPVTRPAG